MPGSATVMKGQPDNMNRKIRQPREIERERERERIRKKRKEKERK